MRTDVGASLNRAEGSQPQGWVGQRKNRQGEADG